MRILQVVHSFVPHTMAGTEVYSYRLSKELAKKHEVFVFFRVNNQKEKEYAIYRDNLEGLETYALNNTFKQCGSFRDTYRNSCIDQQFGELLDKIKPHIVHIHHLLFLSHGLVEEIKKRNIPVVYTLHDYWLLCYKGQLIKDNLSICNGVSVTECRDCLKYLLGIRKHSLFIYNLLRKRLPVLLIKGLKNAHLFFGKKIMAKKIEEFIASTKELSLKIDLFIAPTQFIGNKFIEYGFGADKILYSGYGFNMGGFCSSKKEKSDLLRFAYLGTLLPMKGVDILISAFKELKYQNIQLSIYGKLFAYSGFESYPKELNKLTGNDKRIKFMGGYNNDKLPGILANIDVVVVPSLWFENSPLVIQEAFMANTPVIASRIGGIPELINDGINGLLFNPGDEGELKEKMEYLINNPEVIQKFRNKLPKVKSIEENAKETEEIYVKLIDKAIIKK